MSSSSPNGSPTSNVSRKAPAPAFVASFDDLRAQLDARTVPSGLLPLFSAPVSARAGGVLSQGDFQQLYLELRGSALPDSPGASLPTLDELRERAAGKRDGAPAVPIAIAQLRWSEADRALVREIAEARREGRAVAVDRVAPHLSEHRALLASALLPDEFHDFARLPYQHHGPLVRFVVPSALFLAIDGEAPCSLEIDFDDGKGPRPVALDQPVEVRYEAPGTRRLAVTARGAGGPATARFSFEVASGTAAPDEIWPVDATIPYEGKCNTGVAYVLYGSDNGVKHTQLVRPAIMADGFPGHSYDYMYKWFNQLGTLQVLLANGYDVILLSYTKGSDYVQRNAFVAVALIQKVLGLLPDAQKLVVGGASMGGIVTRYALCYMQSTPDLVPASGRVSVYLSFDSPHTGASLPVATQWFLQASADASDEAGSIAKLLRSTAAQQMLIYSRTTTDASESLTKPVHTALYGELAGYGDFPLAPSRYGISDGTGDGSHIMPNGAKMLEWEVSDGWLGYCKLWALPGTSIGPYDHVVGQYSLPSTGDLYEYSLRVDGTQVNYDGSPGGLSVGNGDVAASLKKASKGYDSKTKCYYPRTCFIPSVSATAVGGSPFQAVPATPTSESALDYCLADRNYEHIVLTPDMKSFMLQALGISTAGALLVKNVQSYDVSPSRVVVAGPSSTGTVVQAKQGSLDAPFVTALPNPKGFQIVEGRFAELMSPEALEVQDGPLDAPWQLAYTNEHGSVQTYQITSTRIAVLARDALCAKQGPLTNPWQVLWSNETDPRAKSFQITDTRVAVFTEDALLVNEGALTNPFQTLWDRSQARLDSYLITDDRVALFGGGALRVQEGPLDAAFATVWNDPADPALSFAMTGRRLAIRTPHWLYVSTGPVDSPLVGTWNNTMSDLRGYQLSDEYLVLWQRWQGRDVVSVMVGTVTYSTPDVEVYNSEYTSPVQSIRLAGSWLAIQTTDEKLYVLDLTQQTAST
ncbi:MAG TPA: hypothetical protein VFS43_25220 [Polyangiaceae bacterium]|nr:hypothetical protein [Polyangiaceae bacterium]